MIGGYKLRELVENEIIERKEASSNDVNLTRKLQKK